MKRMILPFVLVALIAGGVAWITPRQQAASAGQIRITLGTGHIAADIAQTESQREQGLSGRASLDDSHGMLFVFQRDDTYAFWMKDMLFSIDMLWLDSSKRVIHIAADASPQSYPASFVPPAPARYVIEVPAGWARRYGVDVGSVADF